MRVGIVALTWSGGPGRGVTGRIQFPRYAGCQEMQIPPLRYASVAMTNLLFGRDEKFGDWIDMTKVALQSG